MSCCYSDYVAIRSNAHFLTNQNTGFQDMGLNLTIINIRGHLSLSLV